MPTFKPDDARNAFDEYARRFQESTAKLATKGYKHIAFYEAHRLAAEPTSNMFTTELSKRWKEGDAFLDLGCGVGTHTITLAARIAHCGIKNYTVVGADISGVSIEVANAAKAQLAEAVRKHITFVQLDICEGGAEGKLLKHEGCAGGFDGVIGVQSICKMDAPARRTALGKCFAMLRDGGLLVCDWADPQLEACMARVDFFRPVWARPWGEGESRNMMLIEKDADWLEQSRKHAVDEIGGAGFGSVETRVDYLWNGPGGCCDEPDLRQMERSAGADGKGDPRRHEKITQFCLREMRAATECGWFADAQEPYVLAVARK